MNGRNFIIKTFPTILLINLWINRKKKGETGKETYGEQSSTFKELIVFSPN